MTVKQISVFLENQPGKLAEVAAVLSAQKINLRAISVAEASDLTIKTEAELEEAPEAVMGLDEE